MAMVTSKDGSLTALLSAHQSIGLPQPLKLFGTDEQKQKFFPRLAKGAISRVRAHRSRRRLRSGEHAHARATPTRGRQALHPQRREALVHQRHARRAVRRHGAHAGRRRERQAAQADHRVHRRSDDGPASRSCIAAASWDSRRSRTASSASRTCASRARTFSGAKGRDSSSR